MSELICRKIIPGPGTYMGAFVANNPLEESEIGEFEKKAGTDLDITVRFLPFEYIIYPTPTARAAAKHELLTIPRNSDSFAPLMETTNYSPDKIKGAIFIKLEPRDYPLQDILNGKADHLLKRFAEWAVRFGRPFFVTFGHEMNLSKSPWGGKPELYVKAYHYVYDKVEEYAKAYQKDRKMKEDGACNLTWVWNPNAGLSIDYYPGSKRVDWIAVDAYNWTGSETASQIFSSSFRHLKPLGKPFMIGEYGCAKDNLKCLTDFIEYVTDPKNGIKAFIYFDIDKEEKWKISTPDEVGTFSEAIKKHEELFRSELLLGPLAVIPEKPEKEESDRVLPSACYPDPQLGKTNAYVSLLNRLLVERNVDLEQLDEVLSAIVKAPANRPLDPDDQCLSTDEFERRYPELAKIKELDKWYDYKLYRRVRDLRTYWDNAVQLFSVYVQKITEDTEIDRKIALRKALEMSNLFKDRIYAQLSEDQKTGKVRSPSVYSLGALDLTQAEIHAQVEDGDREFYERGIQLTKNAIKAFLSAELDPEHPSKPDYYSVVKGIITLGDLYSRLANLTFKPEYYDRAEYLYESIIAMAEDNEEALLNRKGLHVNLPDLDISLDVYPYHIREALDFNIDETYIEGADKALTLTGIFHQLKGVALIKRAGVFISRPGLFKTIKSIFDQFARTAQGMMELRYAAEAANLPDEKNDYFYEQAKVIQGSLVMRYADKIKFYNNENGEFGTLFTSTFTEDEFTKDSVLDVKELNEILETPNFFDVWHETAKDMKLTPKTKMELGFSEFFKGEFKSEEDIKKLCQAVKKDFPKMAFKSPDNTVERLNEILGMKNFFDIWRKTIFIEENYSLEMEKLIIITRKARRGRENFSSLPDYLQRATKQLNRRILEMTYKGCPKRSGEVARLIAATEGYRGRKFIVLKDSQRKTIRRLNRLLLEKTYPGDCPKSPARPRDPALAGFYETLDALKNSFPEEERFEILEEEIPVSEANRLTDIARDHFFTKIHPEFKYLYGQSKTNRLEIAIRAAEFVYRKFHETLQKLGKVSDADEWLAFSDEHWDLIEELAEGKTVPEFLKITFNYLKIILLVCGIGHKDRKGKYILSQKASRLDVDKTIYVMEALRLTRQMERDISHLPKVSRIYFEVNAELKEATAMVQLAKAKGEMYDQIRSSRELQEIMKEKLDQMTPEEKKLWEKTTEGLLPSDPKYIAQYSLWLMKRLERRMAPALPPYIRYNTKVILRRQLEEEKFDESGITLNALRIFVKAHIPEELYPAAHPRIKGLMKDLSDQISSRNKAEALKTWGALIEEFDALDAASKNFERSWAEINAWDLHTPLAELYDNQALAYFFLEEEDLTRTYTHSCYMESVISSSLYDQRDRSTLLYYVTEIDEDIDLLEAWKEWTEIYE